LGQYQGWPGEFRVRNQQTFRRYHRRTSIARWSSGQQDAGCFTDYPPSSEKESHLPDELCVLQQVACVLRLNLGPDHSQCLRSFGG
jgi:hypothetical protein